MYFSRNVLVNDPELFEWCDTLAHKANNLYNAALFRIRQCMTSRKKDADKLTENELEVLSEIDRMNIALVSNDKKPRPIPRSGSLSYTFLDDLMKYTDNPDYICPELPKQTAQNMLKHASGDMKSFFKAIRAYNADSSRFTGKPELPHYKRKQGTCSFDVSNQDCVVRRNKKGNYVAKLPKTKCIVSLGRSVPGNLKEVHVTPMNGKYQISFVFDDQNTVPELLTEVPERIAAIDFGIDNFMAVTNNCRLDCLLYKGGVIKSANRLYNKRIAAIMSEQTKGGTDKFVPTPEYYNVTQRRNNTVNDFMLQTGKHFISWCVDNRIDTIVLGDNPFWKQEINIGHKNNQKFVQIPFDRMKKILEYQAERHGIRIMRQEESYTSKASFLDRDPMPVYEKNDSSCSFSGTRIHRGLYRTNTGELINADVNGSANIMRKCITDAFENTGLMHDRIIVIKHPMYDAMIQNQTAQKQK